MCNILFTYAKKGQITVSKVVTKTTDVSHYGLAYNHYAIADSRGIHPEGWHIPTGNEYITLRTYLDPSGSNGFNVAGDMMKVPGTTWWDAGNNGTNSSGFTAKGHGGRRYDGFFPAMGAVYRMWHSDAVYCVELDADQTYFRVGNVTISGGAKNGLPMRWIKDTSDWTEGETVTDIQGHVYHTIKIGNQVWTVTNSIQSVYNNGESLLTSVDAATWAGFTTGACCWYNNDQSFGAYEETLIIDDNTSFYVTVTGQKANPKIVTKSVSQNSPAVFDKLPYDTYDITEEAVGGYTQTSIVPDNITVSSSAKEGESTITNNKT